METDVYTRSFRFGRNILTGGIYEIDDSSNIYAIHNTRPIRAITQHYVATLNQTTLPGGNLNTVDI